MCFHAQQSKDAQALQRRFKASMPSAPFFKPAIYNGFQHPLCPVITSSSPETIQLFSWGLIPFWAKDDSIRKHTLNAKIETITEKPSFRNIVHQRCLILADGFFEWKWLDEKGKNKQKYAIQLPQQELFGFAGLWSEWTDKSSGEIRQTYTILTMDANPFMSEIHNSKKRMPLIIAMEDEQHWLQGKSYTLQNDRLMAIAI